MRKEDIEEIELGAEKEDPTEIDVGEEEATAERGGMPAVHKVENEADMRDMRDTGTQEKTRTGRDEKTLGKEEKTKNYYTK